MLLLRLAKQPRVVALAGALGAVMVSASVALAASNYTLSISGSTTVFPVAVAVYNAVYSTSPVGADTSVTSPDSAGAIGQPGSGVGYTELFCGVVDVSNGSRPAAAGDIKTCAPYGGSATAPLGLADIDSWVVGKDGITIIVQSASLGSTVAGAGLKVSDLTNIYNCTWTNWQQVNGAFPNTPIQAYSREITSGTYGDFLKFINVAAGSTDGNSAPTAGSEQACFGNNVASAHDANHHRAQGNPGMAAAAQNNANAVAYVGLGFADQTGVSKVGLFDAFNSPVLPTPSSIDAQINAQNGGAACTSGACYPFGRQLFMNTIKYSSVTKAGVPGARATNLSKAIAFVNAAAGKDGQQQFVNEGEAGLTTKPGTPDTTLQNHVTAGSTVTLTPVGGGAGQQINPQAIPNADVNLDSNINITDVSLIGQVWLSAGPNGGGACPAAGGPSCGFLRQDVNQDGNINITDVSSVGAQWQVAWQKWVL